MENPQPIAPLHYHSLEAKLTRLYGDVPLPDFALAALAEERAGTLSRPANGWHMSASCVTASEPVEAYPKPSAVELRRFQLLLSR